jgi:ribosomal protein S18 acetylase RimI-like enzyme
MMHGVKPVVRDLGPQDAGAFQALRLRGLRECPAAFASSYEEEADEPLDAVARRLAPAPGRVVLGAWDGASLAGVVGLARESPCKLAHKALLWGMYVAPEYRGRSVGRLLVAQALERSRAMAGVRQVTLGVNAANRPAIGLYEAAGFRTFGREPDFMLVDGVPHDELHMVCMHGCTAPAPEADRSLPGGYRR